MSRKSLTLKEGESNRGTLQDDCLVRHMTPSYPKNPVASGIDRALNTAVRPAHIDRTRVLIPRTPKAEGRPCVRTTRSHNVGVRWLSRLSIDQIAMTRRLSLSSRSYEAVALFYA